MARRIEIRSTSADADGRVGGRRCAGVGPASAGAGDRRTPGAGCGVHPRRVRTMRVALVGARGHGARHVENLLRLGHDGTATFVGVVEVADVDVPVPSYPDLPSLAAELHPEIVVISSPPSTHRDLVLSAFALGCDVLV